MVSTSMMLILYDTYFQKLSKMYNTWINGSDQFQDETIKNMLQKHFLHVEKLEASSQFVLKEGIFRNT
jgi:hypothetical protein